MLVEATMLHDKKNNDYNGSMPLYAATGIKGRFADIWRKTIRLFSLVWEGNTRQVANETIRDTAIDLIVYTTLFILMLDKKKEEGGLIDSPKYK